VTLALCCELVMQDSLSLKWWCCKSIV